MSRCLGTQSNVHQACSLTEMTKLIGSDNVGAANQGISCALSGDGLTLAIGGATDSSNNGAVWIFVREYLGASWIQEAKLSATDNIGAASQGVSCDLSHEGNTLVFGGPNDNGGQGAVWVYYRADLTWSELAKLTVTDNVGNANLGVSCSVSADGTIVAAGGPFDNNSNGAVWAFVYNGDTYVETSKLIGTGNKGAAQQGYSCSLSSDGLTLAVGGYQDNNGVGATWIFANNGSSLWSQQGPKLVGRGSVGAAGQGYSTALSADGTVLAVGGPFDDTTVIDDQSSSMGAVWMFSLGCGSWTQQSPKLVGSGSIGDANQGYDVDLSDDGQTLAVGGPSDNSEIGAVWMFNYSCSSWSQTGKLVGSNNVGVAQEGCSVSLTTDATTLAFGGYLDNGGQGAVWIFTSSK